MKVPGAGLGKPSMKVFGLNLRNLKDLRTKAIAVTVI